MKLATREVKAFKQASEAANTAAAQAFNAAVQAKMYADRVNKTYSKIQEELKKIAAKRTLGYKLTEREAAIWVLYGEAGK